VSVRWLVDGMNVIGSRPDGWWRDRPGAVRDLLARLAAYRGATDEEVTVVFDGRRPDRLPDPGGVGVAFAPACPGGADDEIAHRVKEDHDPPGLRVVTSDAGLAARVREHGAQVVGARSFRDRLPALRLEPGEEPSGPSAGTWAHW
jgi:predicted RNA-binding protein with PIN domain